MANAACATPCCPAARLLYRYFFRAAGSFFLIGLIGLDALALCLFFWKLLPAHQVWLAGLLAQTGLFLLLASRFWQRGMEAALVMSVDPPMIAAEDLEAEEEEEEPVTEEEVLAGLTEPTLRDLVNKLRNEPWAAPEPASSAGPIPIAPEPKIVDDPKISLVDRIDRHATKFPLGGPQQPAPLKSEPQKADGDGKNPAPPGGLKATALATQALTVGWTLMCSRFLDLTLAQIPNRSQFHCPRPIPIQACPLTRCPLRPDLLDQSGSPEIFGPASELLQLC